MNPNSVEIVRVYTREVNGTIPDNTPHIPVGGGSFKVVVEAEAGSVTGNGGAPYRIHIEAFDYTTGNNAGPAIFTRDADGNFGLPPWNTLNHQEVFTINVPAAVAVNMQDHILKYLAYLVTPRLPQNPEIVSFAESPLFMLTGEG